MIEIDLKVFLVILICMSFIPSFLGFELIVLKSRLKNLTSEVESLKSKYI